MFHQRHVPLSPTPQTFHAQNNFLSHLVIFEAQRQSKVPRNFTIYLQVFVSYLFLYYQRPKHIIINFCKKCKNSYTAVKAIQATTTKHYSGWITDIYMYINKKT